MRRPPRDPRHALLGLRLLAGGIADGALVFAASALVYASARMLGCTDASVAAAAFVALVTGNVGLIALNRGSGLLRTRNTVFWIVVGGAIGVLAATLGLPQLGHFFRFEAPPAGVLALAAGLPLAALVPVFLVRTRASAAPVARA